MAAFHRPGWKRRSASQSTTRLSRFGTLRGSMSICWRSTTWVCGWRFGDTCGIALPCWDVNCPGEAPSNAMPEKLVSRWPGARPGMTGSFGAMTDGAASLEAGRRALVRVAGVAGTAGGKARAPPLTRTCALPSSGSSSLVAGGVSSNPIGAAE